MVKPYKNYGIVTVYGGGVIFFLYRLMVYHPDSDAAAQ